MSATHASMLSHFTRTALGLLALSGIAHAAPGAAGPLAIGRDGSAPLIENHGDAIIAEDGSVLPETGSVTHRGDARQAAAEALFQQALELTAEGNFAEACAKFEASEALDVGVGTLLHLADCYERLGRFASAWAAFRRAEALARVHGMISRWEIAVARAKELEPKLSRLIIEVPPHSRVSGLRITLGESTLSESSWGTALPVDPGHWSVAAEAVGFAPARVNVDVPSEEPRRLRIVVPRLEPLVAPQPVDLRPAAPEPRRAETGLRTLGLVLGASGVVSLGAAGILAAVAAEKNEQSLDHCARSNACSEEGVNLREQAGTLADLATITAGAGGALLLGGVTLFAATRERPAQTPKQKAALSVSPTLTHSGGGLRLGGRF